MNSPNRIQHIEALFHAALECPLAGRAAFLAPACAGDQSLLDAVNALLVAHGQEWSLLDQDHVEAEFDNTSAPTRNLPATPGPQSARSPVSQASSDGQREGRIVIGAMLAERYRIVGLLGKGGMGEVYLAHDARLRREA